MKKKRLVRILVLVPCILAIILGSWAFYFEPSSLRVHKHRLKIPNWPSTHHDMRVGVLADLHVGSPYYGIERLKRIVRKTNRAKCDLILIPGDLVVHEVIGGTFVSPEDIAQVLRGLHAPLGVYAVLGNHDWWLYAKRVEDALEGVGIQVLNDEAVRMMFRDQSLWLVGVTDFEEGPHDVKKALADVNQHEPILLVTHNPDVFPEIPAYVSLTIAGHTHGGQVVLPYVGRPIVPSIYGQRYAIGHIVENDKHLFVSPGIGTSIFPVRFMVQPEISILKLRVLE